MAKNPAPQIENAQIAQMAARFANMPSEQLPQYTKDLRFGALALAEISRRNRISMMDEAAKAQGVEGGTISDQQIGQMMQAKMRERMMNDDRLGLNNIVASAEQGGVDFGGAEEEPQSMAGGGVVSFDRGGPIQYDDGSQGYFAGAAIPYLASGARMAAGYLPRIGRGIADIYNRVRYNRPSVRDPFFIGPIKPTASPLEVAGFGATAYGLPGAIAAAGDYFGGGGGEPPVSDTYPDETQRGSAKGKEAAGKSDAVAAGKAEKEDAKVLAKELGTDAKSILEARRKLEKEAGLGEYGAEAKAVLEKRRQRAETAGKSEYIEKIQEGIKSLGGKRRTDTIGMLGEGLGAIAGATGAESKVRSAAQDAADEIEQKMAMAKELYVRGDIANAQKMAMEAQKDQRDYELNLRKIASLEGYYKAMGAAAGAKGNRGLSAGAAQLMKPLVEARLAAEQAEARAMAKGDKTAAAQQRRLMESIDRQLGQYAFLGGGMQIGTRDTGGAEAE